MFVRFAINGSSVRLPVITQISFWIRALRTSAGTGLEGFKAHAVFQEINKKLQEEGEQFVKKIGGVFAFKVKDGPNGQEATWIVDVKNGSGCVHNDADKKADCTIAMSDTDLLALMTGKMNPQTIKLVFPTFTAPLRARLPCRFLSCHKPLLPLPHFLPG
uniref:Sterol carrier protein 2b n=1 Tax=Poecilia reticulata TaxID=8081 RepID=A0A3P9PDK2_POERE